LKFGIAPGQGRGYGNDVPPCHRTANIRPQTLMKTKDTRKETKKLPTKTAKEKKLAKQEKKNAK
jgi:hypothetical protein